MGWLLLELVLFALLAMSPHFASQTFWIILGLVIMIYRWQNILTYWFHDHILTGRVSSPVRALILTLINVIEIVIIFSIIDFILSSAFNPTFVSIANSLDYSIRIMTTLGWDRYEPVGFGYILFYVQVFSGIGTIAIVIGAIMSYFTKPNSD